MFPVNMVYLSIFEKQNTSENQVSGGLWPVPICYLDGCRRRYLRLAEVIGLLEQDSAWISSYHRNSARAAGNE